MSDQIPAEAVEELRLRILAHPVITTMDSGHQERVRIALEGAGFRVGIASIRSQVIEELRGKDAVEARYRGEPVRIPKCAADEIQRLQEENLRLRARLDAAQRGDGDG